MIARWFDAFRRVIGEAHFFAAGNPGYNSNFSRDSLITGTLSQNTEILKSQLEFSAMKQGRETVPNTGEEPGKIHHEFPEVTIRGRSTQYNACDTTALYLIGHEAYRNLTGDYVLAALQRKNIESAAAYILRHLRKGLFVEDPKEFSGADDFALKATYWKDSALPRREGGIPKYPVVYPLAQAINARGLKSAALLLEQSDLLQIHRQMIQALEGMFDHERGTFPIAIDADGTVNGASSDALHMLFYLSPGDIDQKLIQRIVDTSEVLATRAGYRTLDPETAKQVADKYHAETVWPFEQALINAGARKFGLSRAVEITERIVPYIADQHQECFYVDGMAEPQAGGNASQLWTAAARSYFESGDSGSILP